MKVKDILKLSAELALLLPGGSEQRLYLFGKQYPAYQYERYRETREQRQPGVDGEQYQQHSGESDEVRHQVRDDVRVQKLEIPRVVDDAAHKVSGLFVVEEREVQSLHLVIYFPAHVTDQVPGRPVSHVVAQEAENDPEQIQKQYLDGEHPDRPQVRLPYTAAHNTRERREHSGSGQVDSCKQQSRCYGDDIVDAVAHRFL